jgi:ubiquinone/menaquinone biosynthesis C-methylase UbiE
MSHPTRTVFCRRWAILAGLALAAAAPASWELWAQDASPSAGALPKEAAPLDKAAAASGSKTSASEPETPSPLKRSTGGRIADTMHFTGAGWLMRDSRDREEDCAMLLQALGLKSGQTVCDIGCGNGFYSLKMAQLVGDQGQVIGVDIQQEMLRMLEARAKDENVRNIKLVVGGPDDPRLAESSVDLILLVDVYHEFSYPEQMLRGMRKSLKPGGRIALAEFRLEDRNVPIKLLHKMTKKQILKEFEPNGFRLVEQFDRLPWQHLMFFMRDDDPAAGPAAEPGKQGASGTSSSAAATNAAAPTNSAAAPSSAAAKRNAANK